MSVFWTKSWIEFEKNNYWQIDEQRNNHRNNNLIQRRWRILKVGVRIHGVDGVDDVWLTCCALHNWLLDIDGLNGAWEHGVPMSNWEGPMEDMDFEGFNDGVALQG